MDVIIDTIDPPRIPLRGVDERSIEYAQLYDCIRVNGVKQAILVRPKGDRWEVIDGMHRLTISKRLCLKTIPVTVEWHCSDEQAMILAIKLHAHRIDTKPSEYCQHIKRLLKDGNTIDDLRLKLSKTSTWIKSVLSLEQLIPEAQALVDSGDIPLTSACSLAQIWPAPRQKDFLKKAQKMPVQQFKRLVIEFVNQTREALSKGRLIEKYERHRPHAYLRTIKVLKHELATREVAARHVVTRGFATMVDAFAGGVEYCLNLDPESQAAMRRKFDEAANPKKRRPPKSKT